MVTRCKEADHELSSCSGHSAFCVMLKVRSFTLSPLASDCIILSHMFSTHTNTFKKSVFFFEELLEVTNTPSFSTSLTYSQIRERRTFPSVGVMTKCWLSTQGVTKNLIFCVFFFLIFGM